MTEIVNLSAEPDWKIRNWLPRGLQAEQIVFLPDACPGKSPLPTGTAVLTRQSDWRLFAVSDCGCGMRLIRSGAEPGDLTSEKWDRLANRLRRNKGGLGDLGGGNHFLDAIISKDGGPLHFLVHTGLRSESGHVDHLVDRPDAFDQEFSRIVGWAVDNRARIEDEIAAVFGPMELILDLPHNTYERLEDGGAIIRKGSVHLRPGETSIIPSNMTGDIVLARATIQVEGILHSMSHGTGRCMSRSDCKPTADTFDFEALRREVLLPSGLKNESLRTEGPYAYRELDDCLQLIAGYVEEIERFRVLAYMGHL